MTRLRRQIAIGAAATAGWPLVMSRWLASNFYVPLGVLAAGLAIATGFAFRDRLSTWLALSPRNVAIGIGGGILQAGATHALYRVFAPLVPPLRDQVSSLYSFMAEGWGPLRSLPIVVLAIVVEELVWRGAVLEPDPHESSTHWFLPATLSVLSYTVAQAGSGSWVLAFTAFSCGWLWWAVRHLTRSLTAPILMHLIWSLVVLVFVPLESTG